MSFYSGFVLDLPRYSSVEKAKEKLRYAIKNCLVIDTDMTPVETFTEDEIE